jgi:hypothetical protein
VEGQLGRRKEICRASDQPHFLLQLSRGGASRFLTRLNLAPYTGELASTKTGALQAQQHLSRRPAA